MKSRSAEEKTRELSRGMELQDRQPSVARTRRVSGTVVKLLFGVTETLQRTRLPLPTLPQRQQTPSHMARNVGKCFVLFG